MLTRIDLLDKQTVALDHDMAKSYDPHTLNPTQTAVLIRFLDPDTQHDIITHQNHYLSIHNIYVEDFDVITAQTECSDDKLRHALDTYTNELIENNQLFNQEMAKNLLNFIQQHKPERVIVHCHAGISRSVAVALFMAKYYFKNDELYHMINSCENYLPGGNQHIYHQLIQAWYQQKKSY